MRRNSRIIKIGNTVIGGGNNVAVQSMTCSDTADREATLLQLKLLENAGCDIARFTVNTAEAAANIPFYKENISIPLVADIHFDHRLAIKAAESGIDKIRINPGNLAKDDLKAVCAACRSAGIPIRVGVNGGSLEKPLLRKYGGVPTPEAIAESAAGACRCLEECGFDDIVVSVKSSDVRTVIAANRLIAAACDYPLHLGVTEAGCGEQALVKSSVGIGALLADGIGDTIRVSLTENIEKEVEAANMLLYALDLKPHIDIISCPTCGRTKINVMEMAAKLNAALKNIKVTRTFRVAVMGCAVNGPGEASGADIGIAGGIGEALLFRKGVPQMKIPEDKIVEVLTDMVKESVC